MLRVIVTGSPLNPVGKLGWKTQTVGVFLHESPGVESPFAVPTQILVGPDEAGYKPGEYILDACSIAAKADTYGKIVLGIGRWHLTPLGAKGK